MPKPRVNEKAIAAMEKKAAHQREVEAKKRAELEAIEAKEWEKGAFFLMNSSLSSLNFLIAFFHHDPGAKTKTKREIELEKRALKNAKKQESEELLAIEEQNMKKKNSKSKSGNPLLDLKPKYKPIQPARGKEKQAQKKQEKIEKEFEDKQKATGANVESFAASNIDDALDILSGGSGSSDIRGSKKDTPIIDKHPERRAKAA